jgi:glycosyltransferase involved in cell wall biosynthesis
MIRGLHGLRWRSSAWRRANHRHQPTLATRLRKRLYAATVERSNLQRARYLIAIGQYVTDYFAALLAPDVQVFRIANAVDRSFFELEHRPVGGRVLFAGRVNRRKRPLDLVTAFASIAASIPHAELRLAGDLMGEPETAAEVRHAIDAAGLGDRVHLLGPLSEEAVRAEFAPG